jgi:hypothetical protein
MATARMFRRRNRLTHCGPPQWRHGRRAATAIRQRLERADEPGSGKHDASGDAGGLAGEGRLRRCEDKKYEDLVKVICGQSLWPRYVHPSVRPRELISPAQPPAQGDGGFQHAPVLRESTMTLTKSVGALISSVPLP